MNIKSWSFSVVYLYRVFLSSCSQYHSNGKSSLTVSENEHEYKLLADYPERNTGKVENYMNETIGSRNDISFSNTTIDAQLTLDEEQNFMS